MQIEVEPKGKEWRASVRLGEAFVDAPGVFGQGTSEGPWLEADGPTPAIAIKRLCERVGRAWLGKPE